MKKNDKTSILKHVGTEHTQKNQSICIWKKAFLLRHTVVFNNKTTPELTCFNYEEVTKDSSYEKGRIA